MPKRRIVILLVLVAWLVPAANAAVVTMHVAAEHRGVDHTHDGDHSHDPAPTDLAAVLHGHRHDESAPSHEHAAPRQSPPGLEGVLVSENAASACIGDRIDERSLPPPGQGVTGSVALIYCHCSLRL